MISGVHLATALLAVGLALAAWRRRVVPGARACSVLLVVTAVWTAAAAGEHLSAGFESKLRWFQVLHTASAASAPVLLVFALQYTGRGAALAGRGWVLVALMSLVPAVAAIAAWRDPFGDGIFRLPDDLTEDATATGVLPVEPGPFVVVYALHNVFLAVGALALFATARPLPRGVGRALILAIGLGIAVSTLVTILRLYGVDPGWGTRFRPVTLAQTLFVVCLALGIGRLRLLETFLGLGPLARAALTDNQPDGVVVLDHQRRVYSLNRAAPTILGMAAADVLDRRWDDVLRAAGVLSEPLVGGGHDTVVTGMGRYEVRITPLGAPPHAAGHLVILQDVTALARALDERRTARQRVIQQERLSALGQMAAGIAHDLDNTLGQVARYAGHLSEDLDLRDADPETRGYVELIRAGISDATSVIARIRGFYRPRSDSDVFEAADLVQLVEETVALTRPRWHDIPRVGGHTITITRDLQRVPPMLVDPAALREALTNLIFNAVDALPQGGHIAIQLRADGGTVTLAVRDDGVGMTPEQQSRCLEPFYTTKGVHGTGLGLAMVHGIAKRHGGTVEVESDLGRGTWIAVHLRVREAQAGSAPAAAQPVAKPPTAAPGSSTSSATRDAVSTTRSPEPSIGAQRALVVDDETPTRQLIAALLMHDGYSVDTAPDGVAALQMMNAARRSSNARYDVLITDQVMPGITGTQLAHAIRTHTPRVPVVLVTAFAYVMEGSPLPAGVDVLVSKPFDATTLRSAVSAARAATTP